MTGPQNEETAQLDACARELYGAVAARLRAFVEERVTERLAECGVDVTDEAAATAADAGRRAEAAVLPRLAALLEADIDEQATTPVAVVRGALPFATAALDELGAEPAHRERFLLERFPDDRYGLAFASLDALGDDVGEQAIAWGAAKAIAHRRRHAPG